MAKAATAPHDAMATAKAATKKYTTILVKNAALQLCLRFWQVQALRSNENKTCASHLRVLPH